ncbi:hypothetical protein ABZ776_04205 [Streptomyces sp. NPDC007076]|uniref:hypothetical protein n=1 Tax=unclassified Streptomyces TaxID=2593676 RepID=UPI0033FCB8C6
MTETPWASTETGDPATAGRRIVGWARCRGDLQERLDAVMEGPAEAALLLDAVVPVGGELDLPRAPRRIVEAAVVVVDADDRGAGSGRGGNPVRAVPAGGRHGGAA